MAAPLIVESLGLNGCNVDKDPLELGDNELMQAVNFISDPQSGQSAIRKRPGLIAFNMSTLVGTILGGCDLPLADQSVVQGVGISIYIGRAPTS